MKVGRLLILSLALKLVPEIRGHLKIFGGFKLHRLHSDFGIVVLTHSRDRHMAHMAASNRHLAKNRHVCSKREKSHLWVCKTVMQLDSNCVLFGLILIRLNTF